MTAPPITRRGLLAASLAAAAWPGGARADAPKARPVAKPLDADGIVAQARLSGEVSYLVLDRQSGAVIESRGADRAMPPASVAKTATALYAMTALGGRARFTTRVIATGPVTGGQVQGDLVLAGGGDPALDTDGLGDLVAALRAAGVRGVTGRFLLWAGALPAIDRIDPSQPPHLGYNATISGLNLNFNRVQFGWRQQPSGLAITLDAPAERFNATVTGVRVRAVAREAPLFTYTDAGRVENWTVAAGSLSPRGSRWLPVRHPDLYAGEVFRALAGQAGLRLPEGQPVATLPPGTVLAERRGDELALVLRDMLKHSNNLMAETAGLTASAALGGPVGSLSASAGRMSDWARDRYGLTGSRFGDHSGLGPDSRTTAADLVRLLRAEGPLPGLLKPFAERPVAGEPSLAGRVLAKTGTLNFVSTLAGYLTAPSGRTLCFAILTADPERRSRVAPEDREAPPGAREWEVQSRMMQRALLARWSRPGS